MKLNHKILLALFVLLAFVGAMGLLQYTQTNTPQQSAFEGAIGEDYAVGAVNETFTKDDFTYGPQTWKPYASKLPIVPEEANRSGEFYLLFIDLYAGPIGQLMDLTDSGAVKVEYSFTNLMGFAAFHAYGYCEESNQGRGVSWTNRVEGFGASGYYVTGMGGVDANPPKTAELGKTNHIYVQVANDRGAKYDDYDDGTYYMKFDQPAGGVNALHITTNPETPAGQVTYTDKQSGVFYVSDTGGRGFDDDAVLLVAVSGGIPDDFELRIKSSGYNSPRGMVL
jgi:hypothetical protein